MFRSSKPSKHCAHGLGLGGCGVRTSPYLLVSPAKTERHPTTSPVASTCVGAGNRHSTKNHKCEKEAVQPVPNACRPSSSKPRDIPKRRKRQIEECIDDDDDDDGNYDDDDDEDDDENPHIRAEDRLFLLRSQSLPLSILPPSAF